MDMLNQGFRIGYCCLVLFLVLFSCNEELKMNNEKFSKEIIGENEYTNLLIQTNDSIEKWCKNKLGYYQYCGISKNCKLDNLICFNSTKDKFVGAFLMQQLLKEGVQDDIWFFYGAKIDSKWYFFQGATIVLPREIYQKDVTKPLSFEKLHEIALKEVFSGYLKEKERPFWQFWKPVEYEPDEVWFDYHFKGPSWGCGYYNDQGVWINCPDIVMDSVYMIGALDKYREKHLTTSLEEDWEYYFHTKFTAKKSK